MDVEAGDCDGPTCCGMSLAGVAAEEGDEGSVAERRRVGEAAGAKYELSEMRKRTSAAGAVLAA